MVNRKRAIAVLAAVLMTGAGVSSAMALSSSRVNHVTFSGTVALPGIVLPGGTDIFEAMAGSGGGQIVRVSSREGRHYFMAFTRVVDRPATIRPDQVVTLGEAPAGAIRPIAAWFPVGSSRGHQFLYSR
jgi:type 1 fimbria pilin